MLLTILRMFYVWFLRSIFSVFLFLIILPWYFPVSAQGTSPDSVLDEVVKAINHSSEAGNKASEWSQQKQELLAQIREMELKNQWTEFQIERHETWIKNETKDISLIKSRLAQVENVRIALDPLIEIIYAKLEESIRNDLPFFKEERRQRLAFLRQELDKTGAGLGHRLGRLMEVLQVEAMYGQGVDAKDIIATIDGVKQQVTVFRLGRLALFRISQDNQLVQIYGKKNNLWNTIPAKHSVELRKAASISAKKRVTSIVELPVGFRSTLLPEIEKEKNGSR